MYHEYPYEAQIPILIEGKYETRTFTSNNEVWDIIRLLVDEAKQHIKEGKPRKTEKQVQRTLSTGR